MDQKTDVQRQEVDRNFEAFASKLDEYMRDYRGRHALMKDGKVIEFYSNFDDAYRTGMLLYKDGVFSIQKVTKTPADLGHFSHAVSIW